MRMRLSALSSAAASFVIAVLSVAPAAAQMMAQPPAYYQPPYYQQPQPYSQSYPAPVQPYPGPGYYPPPSYPQPQYPSSCCCPVTKRGLFTNFSPCGYGVVSPSYPQYPAYAPYPQPPAYPQYQPYPQYPSYPQYQAYPEYTAYPPAVYPQPRLKVRYKVRKRARTTSAPPPRSPYVYGPWGTR